MLTAGLLLTLNLKTNSTIPVSQPLSCVSLSCANLSLSLTSQISQWSSSIETMSSDKSVNRKLQPCRCLMFPVSLNSKVNTRSFFTSRPYINPKTLEMQHAETQRSFCCRVLFLRKSLRHRLCPALTSQCCTYPKASAGCQRSAPMT